MPGKQLLVGRNNEFADVDVGCGDSQALVVATRPLKCYNSSFKFFVDDVYGSAMNQNFDFGATPVPIHDGTDSALWTGSAIAGTWDFASTAEAHTGTKSVDATATLDGDVAQFARGSDLVTTNYAAITGWIYITRWENKGTKHVELELWYTGTGTTVGLVVDIDNYINTSDLLVWQKFTIPLQDMGVGTETIDAIRVTNVDIGQVKSSLFYLDDMQVEENGSLGTYNLTPDTGMTLIVDKIRFTMVDAYAGTVADGTMQGIPYDSFLGVAELINGLIYQSSKNGAVVQTIILKKTIDILQYPNTAIVDSGSDGTNSWMTIEVTFPEPFVMIHGDDDVMTIEISEDLSGLLFFKTSASGRVEVTT